MTYNQITAKHPEWSRQVALEVWLTALAREAGGDDLAIPDDVYPRYVAWDGEGADLSAVSQSAQAALADWAAEQS